MVSIRERVVFTRALHCRCRCCCCEGIAERRGSGALRSVGTRERERDRRGKRSESSETTGTCLFGWPEREQKADFLSKCLAERKRSHAYDDDDDDDGVCPYCTTFFLGEEGERERVVVVRARGYLLSGGAVLVCRVRLKLC